MKNRELLKNIILSALEYTEKASMLKGDYDLNDIAELTVREYERQSKAILKQSIPFRRIFITEHK